MLNITYPCWDNVYPSLYISVSERRYQEHREYYDCFSTNIVEEIIDENELIEGLRENGYHQDVGTIAYWIWSEMLNVGMKKTHISEWEEDDYEELAYFNNLPQDEQEEYLEEQRESFLDTFLRILKKDRHYPD